MPIDANILESLDLFTDLKPDEIEQIASLIHDFKVTEGEVLMRRGDPAHTFFIILSGNFMVHFKKERAFTLHKKGEVMGWSTVVTPFRYTGTAVAVTEGEVLSIDGQEFLRFIQSNAPLGDKIMKKINTIVAERMPFVTGEINREDN